jgi:acetylornithine deacetylase/succinyl-diaminopimelate desuccinylase-like protein
MKMLHHAPLPWLDPRAEAVFAALSKQYAITRSRCPLPFEANPCSILAFDFREEFMKTIICALLGTTLLAQGALAQTAPLRPDQVEFRGLYKELVETNTTLSAGSCTLAAERMAARLKAAGMADSQLTLFATPEHPKEGGLVAIYPGTSKTLKPMLLLAHIDVVEAKREDWVRDPFTLIEEGGYFYARGTYDDKAQAAIFTDILVRFSRDKYRPKRTIKLALTCGEETSGAFNGAEWLAKNRSELINAEFALNEGGGGRTNGTAIAAGGKLTTMGMQVGEKAYQDFTLTVTNPGGHSSQPVPQNAIYELSAALGKIAAFEFPLQFSDVTRTYFRRAGAMRGDETGTAMVALEANLADAAAEAIVNKDKMLHSLLRSTCVATLTEAGHALNALPQRATANVNCRMFPGRTAEETQAALERVIGNPNVKIVSRVTDKPIAVPPPLDPKIVAPAEALLAKYHPGVPMMPSMSTGATDAVYLKGIPTYGVPGTWGDPDGNGTHGLNERIEVRALYTGRDYLTDLVKVLAK